MNKLVTYLGSVIVGFALGAFINHMLAEDAADDYAANQKQDAVAVENRVYAACVVTVVGAAQSEVTAYEMRKIISQACDK